MAIHLLAFLKYYSKEVFTQKTPSIIFIYISTDCSWFFSVYFPSADQEHLGMCKCWACTNRLIGLHLIANGLQLPLELALGSAMLLFAFGPKFSGLCF